MHEQWEIIEEFPNYDVSNFGRIYNRKAGHFMSISRNNFGHTKVSLIRGDGERLTRSVALIVAKAFVEAPNPYCDHLIILDGDFGNVVSENLAWRPIGFAYEYTRQLKQDQPLHYCNLETTDLTTGIVYSSIVHCGTTEGLLFKDLWRSTYLGTKVYPFEHVYKITQKLEE